MTLNDNVASLWKPLIKECYMKKALSTLKIFDCM